MESRTPREQSHTPSLSVIVPVRNEEQHIADIIYQLESQSLDAAEYEILIVDGRSEDRTREVVQALQQKYVNLRLLDNPRYLSGAARNLGVRAARGEYVLFVDGHCRILSRDMLSEVLKTFRSGKQCISRPQPQITDGVTSYQRAVSRARHSPIGHNVGSAIYTSTETECNPMSAGCGYTRELYQRLGGVDEQFDAAEDVEFNLRVHQAGIRAYHSEQFSVGYFPRKNFLALFRQLFRYGYGRARLARKHHGYWPLAGVLLSLFSLAFILLPFLGIFWRPFLTSWAMVSLGYALVTAIAAALQARGEGVRMWLLIWSCFPAIHFGSGLGFLSGLVGGFSWNHAPSAGASRKRSSGGEKSSTRTASFREHTGLSSGS